MAKQSGAVADEETALLRKDADPPAINRVTERGGSPTSVTANPSSLPFSLDDLIARQNEERRKEKEADCKFWTCCFAGLLVLAVTFVVTGTLLTDDAVKTSLKSFMGVNWPWIATSGLIGGFWYQWYMMSRQFAEASRVQDQRYNQLSRLITNQQREHDLLATVLPYMKK